MDLPDFSAGFWPLWITLLFFLIITGRYFLMSGIFYLIFYKGTNRKWESRKIIHKDHVKGQLRKEIKWSVINAFIFAITGMITLILWQKGFTKIYIEWNDFPIWYLPVSVLIYLLLQETYYYWIHRWMHIPSVFKVVHLVHHQSTIVSPFTAFSFHPLEGILQAIILPVLFLLIPIHLYMLIIILIVMSITSVINHLGFEIYPKKSYLLFGKWVIGASHHSLHHTLFKYNFGLFFTFWDHIAGTESPGFEGVYKELVDKEKKA